MSVPRIEAGEGDRHHFHPSRYPHALKGMDGMPVDSYALIRCWGATEDECRDMRMAGEFSRMLELECRKAGVDVNAIVKRHEAENPEDWRAISEALK